ncbi:hypothetical protein M9H77_31055 [Catharanthus roseus]|uniref:Uncharacterized protein n=1 Tax=Catharanthus roseus TaxID=4058 RepID=A0ACC0A1B4_CATRO|nr:hypothetical protein M9H77_31055 [Catharanthus roseus]
MKSRSRILDVPLVDVLFQEDINIAETLRIDVDVQDIGTLIHELGQLESVDIRRRRSIIDEDESNEDEEKMVRGSKRRAHSAAASTPVEMSTMGTSAYSASILPGTSLSSVTTSTPPGMSTPSAAASTSPTTLTPFPQLPYSSLAPMSTPSSASSTAWMLSKPAPSSSARPSTPDPSSAPSPTPSFEDVVDSHILILPTAYWYLFFNKKLDYVKVIIEIMKAHFVEAHPRFGKVPNGVKNIWCIEFGKRYQWDPMHECAIVDAL